MTPLEWLRRRAGKISAAATLPAETGLLAAGADRLLSDLHLLAGAAPSAPVHEASAQPTAVLQLTSALSREEVDGLRAAFTEHIDAAIAAGSSLPIAMRSAAQAVEGELVEIVARAPWVPTTTTVKHSAQETQLLNTAFERDSHCGVCAFRYSRCYCRGNR